VSEIAATSVTTVSPTKITCTFDLTGQAIGPRHVLVANPDGPANRLDYGFTVLDHPPTVSAAAPASAFTTDSVYGVVVSGGYFKAGAVAMLRKAGEADILATNTTFVNSNKLTCDFVFSNVTRGLWDVAIKNPDEQVGSLTEAFAVSLPDTGPVSGVSLRFTSDLAVSTASEVQRFRVWGRVITVDSINFDIDDGSGRPVRVRAPGYTNLITGSYVVVEGTLDPSASVVTIVCLPSDIQKYQ
jgi:hypothetical protein